MCRDGQGVFAALPLCPLHYHGCVSGKTPTVDLRDGLGCASYNERTKSVGYSASVPANRLPIAKSERVKKGGDQKKGTRIKFSWHNPPQRMRSIDGVWPAFRFLHILLFMSIRAQASA